MPNKFGFLIHPACQGHYKFIDCVAIPSIVAVVVVVVVVVLQHCQCSLTKFLSTILSFFLSHSLSLWLNNASRLLGCIRVLVFPLDLWYWISSYTVEFSTIEMPRLCKRGIIKFLLQKDCRIPPRLLPSA